MRPSASERHPSGTAPPAAATRPHGSSVVVGKLVPPETPAGVVTRERLLQQVAEHTADHTRVVAIVAPAGCGKTIAARQLVEADPRTFVWLNVDCLDDDPAVFWLHLLTALRWAEPCIGEEPERLLDERGPHDPAFLAELISALEKGGTPALFVLDDACLLTEPSVLAGLSLLIDRIGDVVCFVFVGRSLPHLPFGRWRARGWVHELQGDELRFTDAEAVAAVAALRDVTLSPELAIAINARVAGWPTGVILAAQSVHVAPDPAVAVLELSGADRLFVEYFTGELLDQLTPAEQRIAMSLSVLDSFDADLCCELLGADAVPAVADLSRRHGFLTSTDPATGMVRFHPLLRETLEHELAWLDPDLRCTLHRRLAARCQQRGDLSGAHRHLSRIGAFEEAAGVVIEPMLSLVDRGDLRGLSQLTHLLPRVMHTDDPGFAFDVAIAWTFVGNLVEGAHWCERAEALSAAGDPAMQQRLHTVRAMLALLGGEIAVAQQHVAAYTQLAYGGRVGPLEDRFATTAARVMLAAGRPVEASAWVERSLRLTHPPVISQVNAPALAAWLELELGRLGPAGELAEAACARVDDLGMRPHYGALDAMVVAGWCRLAAGDLAGAAVRSRTASTDAELLGVPWTRVRSGVLAAELRRLAGDPHGALAVLSDLRTDLTADSGAQPGPSGHLAEEISVAEALALLAIGEPAEARRKVEELADRPRRRVLMARIALQSGGGLGEVVVALGERSGWSPQLLLESEVCLAAGAAIDGDGVADGAEAVGAADRLTAALREGAASGWVLPFLGHGDVIESLLQQLPVAALHPALARARSLPVAGSPQPDVAEYDRLTPRELRLLDFLPTHLSYAEIGERLFISVNTVKTNLKKLYRKLGATTRAEAVERAAQLGLLRGPVPPDPPHAGPVR